MARNQYEVANKQKLIGIIDWNIGMKLSAETLTRIRKAGYRLIPSAATRVLLVAEESADAEILKDILRLEGYLVDTAETGREAVEKAKARYYNLALLGIKLPDMEGTRLLTEMHKGTPG